MEEITKIHVYLMIDNSHSSLIDMLNDPDIKISCFKDINKIIEELKQSAISIFEHKILIIYTKSPSYNIIKSIKRIKSDSSIRTIPVFLISEFVHNDVIREAYFNSINGYIIKSRDDKKFRSIIDSFKDLWLKNVELPY